MASAKLFPGTDVTMASIEVDVVSKLHHSLLVVMSTAPSVIASDALRAGPEFSSVCDVIVV